MEKGAFWSPSTTVANFTFIFDLEKGQFFYKKQISVFFFKGVLFISIV